MASSKILKNTTGSDIFLDSLGINIPDNDQVTIETADYLLLASSDAISELTPLINSGDIVVNDGVSDITDATEAIDFLKYPDAATSVYFDNTTANLDDNPRTVQKAIEKVKGFRVQPIQFQFIGQMNFDQYLISGNHVVNNNNFRRSGDASNGYRYGNSAPSTSLYSGTVVSAAASITGIAQSTGSPAANLELKFELWKVGFNGEGTKLGDIIFNIDSSSYTIGNWWNSSILTEFSESQAQNVNVSAGDILGLKFIRQTGNNKVVAITNTTVVLEIEGSA